MMIIMRFFAQMIIARCTGFIRFVSMSEANNSRATIIVQLLTFC